MKQTEKTIKITDYKIDIHKIEHKFNIIFNPEQNQKDAKISTTDTELLDEYIEAMKPKLENIINIFNVDQFRDKDLTDISEKDLFEAVNADILQYVREPSKQFCMNLQDKYIEDSLKNCNAIISIKDGDKMISFATVYFNVPDELYIDVLCSSQLYSGGGNQMIKKIKQICKLMEITDIKLSSVTESLGFYVKHNFECDELCSMKLKVGGKKTRKWSTKYKKSINCKKPKGFSQKQHCKYGRKPKKSQ